MNVFLLILAGILVLILLLLFCPLTVKVRFDDKVRLKLGYFFAVIPIPIGPPDTDDPAKLEKIEAKKSKKEEKKQKKAEKKRLKQEKKLEKLRKAGKEPPEETKKPNFVVRKLKQKGLSGLTDLLGEIVRILGGLVKKITDHLVISKMDLKLLIACDDAASTALTYGRACSAIYPMIAFIQQHVKKCRHHEQIAPSFTETKTRIRFVLKIRIMPFFLLSAALGAGIRAIKALLK